MKTVIIGASGGIGRAIAIELASLAEKDDILVLQGRSTEKLVTLLSDISLASAISLASETKAKKILIQHEFSSDLNELFCNENGSRTKLAQKRNCPLDENVTSSSASELIHQVKTCDRLIVCFGPFLQKPLDKMNFEEWSFITQQNLALPGTLISLALPHMMKKKKGNILLFGGTATDEIRAFKTNAAYGAAKIALGSLVKSVAQNYEEYNIRCNAILPGFVKTEYVNAKQEAHYIELAGGQPMITTQEIAHFAIEILTDESKNGNLFRFDKDWHNK